MVQQIDAKAIKEAIIRYLKDHGPSLPVSVAKRIGLNSIFTSAFLSELASDGHVKISDMKVGGSPLYFTPETYPQLERSISYLNPKEREACELLKKSGVLQDELQHPAIRVALRGLKDFAVPFKQNDKIFWKYFIAAEIQKIEPELKKIEIKIEEPKIEPKIEEKPELKLEKENTEIEKIQGMRLELDKERKKFEQMKKELEEKSKKDSKQIDIFGEPIEKKQKKPVLKKPVKKAKPIEDKFLNEIKAILESKGILLLNVESFDKKEVFAKILLKSTNKAYILAAYNKKKVDDKDLLRAYKKAASAGLEYYVISKGDTSKKTKEAIEAYKKLASMDTIEDQKPTENHADNLEQSNNKL